MQSERKKPFISHWLPPPILAPELNNSSQVTNDLSDVKSRALLSVFILMLYLTTCHTTDHSQKQAGLLAAVTLHSPALCPIALAVLSKFTL